MRFADIPAIDAVRYWVDCGNVLVEKELCSPPPESIRVYRYRATLYLECPWNNCAMSKGPLAAEDMIDDYMVAFWNLCQEIEE